MRIFHVITLSSVGGAQSVVVNLANIQSEKNEVYVISTATGEAWKALNPHIKVIGINQLKREINWLDIIVLLKLIYYRFKYRPDIIHLHSSKIGALGRIAFPANKIVYTVHGFDSIRLANRSFLFVEKLLKNRCKEIVGVSKYDKENLCSEGIRNHVSCVYNGIEDYLLKSVQLKDENIIDHLRILRCRYAKVIISIARDDYPKRIDLFFEVASCLPDYAFVWIGNNNSYDHPDNVYLLGRQPLAFQYLHYADLFVLLSEYEGLPMSILEAFSFGKPVVASKVGGVTELLNGTNGYAVENISAEVAEKIQAVFMNEALYGEMSQNARKTYLEKFTVDKMFAGYNKIYNKIIFQ